jgi:hypothetical protein
MEAPDPNRVPITVLLDLTQSIAALRTKIERIEPIVNDYAKLRENVNGGLIVMGAIGAVLFTAIGFVMRDLWAWVVTHMRTHG